MGDMKEIDNKDPKVTIVIPVYNGEKYVKYAIDSAVAQTYKNLEILVVDDGSSDKTPEIVKSYGNKVRYIRKENGGVSSALNLAIKKMKGEYFSWLSHDDTYEPNKIEREIAFLKEHNYLGKKVVVFADYYLIDKNGKLIAEAKKDHDEIENKPEYNLLKGHINGLTLLIPKKAFDEYGEFDTQLSCAQDYEMWRKMMKTYKFVHMPETIVSTRWHKKQTTHTSPKVKTEGNAFYLKLIKEISDKRMAELEGSKYNFLMGIADFHKEGAYQEFSEQCRKWAEEIFEDAKKEVPKKKVSVIIPFYNRSEETERAIQSVLAQTHKNVEIILVDDGSKDDISNIKKLVKENSNITLLKNPKNSGASVARNLGIKHATGDFIAFLDSDDEFLPNKLERQLQFAIATNGKILHTSYLKIENEKEEEVHSGLETGRCAKTLIYSCQIATPTVMLDLKWLKKKNALFNVDLGIGEDTCLWLELMKNDEYLVGIDEPLSKVHVGNESAAYDEKKQVEGLKAIIKYLINDDYYSKFDLQVSYLMQAYAHYVGKVYAPEEEPIINGGMFKKFAFFAKNEGIKSALKRTAKKITKR